MIKKAERTVVGRDLHRLFHLGSVGSLTDPQLLELFVSGHDESAAFAFEAIVERHGPMVLRICRMVLGDAHAAEDAFQATFLVLARKAQTLGSRELLCNWLHGVATRIARKARARARRQTALDRESALRRAVAIDDAPRDRLEADVYRIVHEEIDCLPRAYRSAVVVCYLQGKSQAQAAAQLHLTETTIRGRLARARKLLGRRLIRRGVAPASVLFTFESLNSCAAELGRAAVRATASSALDFLNRTTTAHATASVVARALAKGELSVMFFHRLKPITGAILALGTLATAGFLFINPAVSAFHQTKRTRSDQSVTVDPDLAKLVSNPIVRAMQISKDSMILSYMPDWDRGDVDNIGLGNNDGGNRALLDWPEIPANLAANPDHQFQIALYSRQTVSHPRPGSIHAFEITEGWPERVSWKTQPKYDPNPVATCKFKPETGWKVFDITPLIRAQAKAGRKGHGVLLRFLSEDFASADHSDYKCVSREGAGEWENRRPLLLIVKAEKP